jgi:hypothetical protein
MVTCTGSSAPKVREAVPAAWWDLSVRHSFRAISPDA